MESSRDALIPQTKNTNDTIWYTVALGFGIGAGWIDIKVGDLLLTAMVVLASCMVLGFMSPRRPWRWVLLIGICIPIVEWLAYFFLSEKPYRAQVYESFLAFMPGIAGAVGGAVGRGVVENLFAKK